MAVFKCKMCGGSLDIADGQSVCTCEYCGTQQTLPKLDSDRKANLYDRANHFRRNNDFDKAMGIYEQILNEDNTDAEAYWSLVLCRYGIEYVEDPSTHKRMPTINRAQYTSIYADENYKAALEHAEDAQKTVYEQEAKAIDEIQKGILAISEKEEPFDVFICYKETDETGRRTPDSVLANDLYHQLTQEGFKVFFARITLEDKLGQEYEPYIFAALNSAKVMVVLGTKPDYFKAVWVKNEWSRYLALIRSGEKKMLIPAYKDMDPYDLPEEFSHLQAQDMTKLGFMQDLIRGIKKIIGTNQPQPVQKETVVVQQSGGTGNTNALIKRGNMALEDHEWQKADEFFEEVLNQDAECAEAYLGKLLAANKLDSVSKYFDCLFEKYLVATSSETLEACEEETAHIDAMVQQNFLKGYLEKGIIKDLYSFDRTYSSNLSCRKDQKTKQLSEVENDKLLTRVRKYAAGELKQTIDSGLDKLTSVLDERIDAEQRKDETNKSTIVSQYKTHIENADAKAKKLKEDADKKILKDYESYVEIMDKATTAYEFEKARHGFEELGSYQMSKTNADICSKKIREIEEEKRNSEIAAANEKKRKITKISVIVAIIVAVLFALIMVTTKVIIPTVKYNKAVELENAGQYEEAITAFKNLNGYKNSDSEIQKCETAISDKKYEDAMQLKNNGQYEEAITAFVALNGYKDSVTEIENCNTAISDKKYEDAMQLKNNGQYEEAITAFRVLNGYKDSSDQIKEIKHSTGYINTLSIGGTFLFGIYEGKEIEWTILDKQDGKVLVITKDAVTQKAYNDKYTSVTWSKCSLRKWLNNDFLKKVFSSEEQSRIITTTVNADKNPTYSTNPGKSTKDKVFLLSINEVEQYFKSNNERICMYDNSACWCWLRSPGNFQSRAANVRDDGSVGYDGYGVGCDDRAVRPALWLNLES